MEPKKVSPISDYFMKRPCEHCPYRRDVKPFLHPERGEELAYRAQNPYNSFPCHKTTVNDETSEDGEMLVTQSSKECAGFLTLQIEEGATCPKGFIPATDVVYGCADDMLFAYQELE